MRISPTAQRLKTAQRTEGEFERIATSSI